MDPAEGWYNSTFVDVGEYGSEGMLSALEPEIRPFDFFAKNPALDLPPAR
jgi:Cu2+-containing amine oxidase